MTSTFEIGDLVWAKMKGYSSWPGRVVKPGPNTKAQSNKNQKWIYFFGSKNYGWVDDKNIEPYLAFKEKKLTSTTKRTSGFQDAVKEIEKFLEEKLKNPEYDMSLPDLKVDKEETPKPRPKKSITKRPSENSFNKSITTTKRQRKSSFKSEENGDTNQELNMSLIHSDSPSIETDLNSTDSLATKQKYVFGFIGCGTMGSRIIKNLAKSGHRVNIYNRTPDVAKGIKDEADEYAPNLVDIHTTPCNIVLNSDIIICCVSDVPAADAMLFENCGVLSVELENKGFVQMSSIDVKSSLNHCTVIQAKRGMYLEAQIQGSRKEAEDGNLVILTAGDRTLFDNCQSCFKAIGKTAFFLGKAGYATKMNMVINLVKSVSMAGLAEAMALADRCGLSCKDVSSIFNVTNLASPYLKDKVSRIVNREFKNSDQALQHMQKDIRICLETSETLNQPLQIAATANEIFKHCRSIGMEDKDCSSIYDKLRH